jgi:hypothetical protein
VIDRWNELVQITRRAVKKIVSRKTVSIFYGYNYCETENDAWVKELRFVSERLRDQALVGDVCLCDNELDIIEAKINRFTYECKTGEKDFTKESNPNATEWLLQNPLCVAYEYAVDYLEALCKRIKLDFKVIEQRCQDIGIDVKITDKGVCEAIDMALKIEEHTCPTDVDLKIDLHQCVVDLQVILAETNCEVDLQTLIQLKNCDVSVDTIISALNCGATVSTLLTEVDCGTGTPVDAEAQDISLPDSVTITVVGATTKCYYTDFIFGISEEIGENVMVTWDFGANSSPSSQEGVGPHTVQYTLAGTKTVTVTLSNGVTEVTDTQVVVVSTCTGNVTGSVRTPEGVGIGSVNVRIYADANKDGVADSGTHISSVFTTSGGLYSMGNLTPGSYVVQVIVPGAYTIVSAKDDTADGDLGTDTSLTDTIIPVTVSPSEIDAGNNFILQAI